MFIVLILLTHRATFWLFTGMPWNPYNVRLQENDMLRAQPRLIRVNLEKLHPTQITVGKEEVALKRQPLQI